MSKKALYRTLKKVSGSGNKRKQSKQTGDLIQKITFATKCLVEKRGMSFATREQYSRNFRFGVLNSPSGTPFLLINTSPRALSVFCLQLRM